MFRNFFCISAGLTLTAMLLAQNLLGTTSVLNESVIVANRNCFPQRHKGHKKLCVLRVFVGNNYYKLFILVFVILSIL